MVCDMENENSSGGEEVRSSSAGPNNGAAAAASRQSPKVCAVPTSLVPAAAVIMLQQKLAEISPPAPKKIMSKNNNNTCYPTSIPRNFAELQLFRVMQNASLLNYYDTLLEMGGDDVQQLCDAGEDEFLEIMSLVGMASKPLHVRRLQKSLQEWVTNPGKFKIPLMAGDDFELELSSPQVTSNHYFVDNGDASRSMYSPSPGEVCALPPITSPGLCLTKRPYSPLDGPSCPPSSSSSPGSSGQLHLTPVLLESHIVKLAEAAERLSKHLPQLEPKPHNAKKKVCKELELVMSMAEDDPRRMDEIRKYAAIYGRFDCKRKPEKPLTLHEVSVNEAAAQICRFVPALLTRRDELFPLARQVVKDSGCHYSKSQLPSSYLSRGSGSEAENCSRSSPRIPILDSEPLLKRPKIEPESDSEDRQEKNNEDPLLVRPSSLHSYFQQHTKMNTAREGIGRNNFDFEDAETQFSFSNSNSPSQVGAQDQDVCTGENNINRSGEDQMEKFAPKVIAASGDNIIAVANPALAMSSAILPIKEPTEYRNEDSQ